MNRFLHIFSGLLCLSAAMSLTTSCSMMKDDVEDCPAGLYVRFVYDYNTARADMFKDHVGHVKLYVYDENGNKVAEQSISNSLSDAPLQRYGYTMHFPDGQLPDGRYRLQAVAMQKDWDEALATTGAKYRRNETDHAHEFTVALDHADTHLPGTEHHAVSNEAPLDTLWHTLKVTALDPIDGTSVPDIEPTSKPYSIYPLDEQYVTIRRERATYATVSLIRDTKHINLTIRNIDDYDAIFHDDFEVYITDANHMLAHDNTLASDDMLRYSPYHSWTTRFNPDGSVSIETGGRSSDDSSDTDNSDLQRTAHYNLMTNRLMYYTGDDISKSATLKVSNRHTGKTVFEINLPHTLSEGRMAYYTYNYSPQEYLDREYDYHLNLFLKGESWAYCDIVINVLGWTKRTYFVEL